MAVEWKKIAMANDLKERTLSFRHEAAASKGISNDGINLLRNSINYTVSDGLDGNFPNIEWSSNAQTGADLSKIEEWNFGIDATGIDSTTAHFWLRTNLTNGSGVLPNTMLNSAWSSVMIVPGGDSSVKKHKIKISGSIRNGAPSTSPDSSPTRLHFSIWRAYAGNYDYMTVGNNGLLFRKVAHDLRYGDNVGGAGTSGALYAPVEPRSVLTFSLNEVEINLDPDECGESKSCHYLVGVWASTSTSNYATATNAVNWPDPNGSQQASIKIQTDITFTPE